MWRTFRYSFFQAAIICALGFDFSTLDSIITTEQCGRISAFLKRSIKYGLTQNSFNINEIRSKADYILFKAGQLSDNNVYTVYYH